MAKSETVGPVTTVPVLDPRALERTLVALDRLKPRLDKANADADALETERTRLYQLARSYGGTYRVIANRYGITQAAVMQKTRRGELRDRQRDVGK